MTTLIGTKGIASKYENKSNVFFVVTFDLELAQISPVPQIKFKEKEPFFVFHSINIVTIFFL